MSTWNNLHRRALIVKSNDIDFLKQFANNIPRFSPGCSCKDDWLQIVKKNLPRFGKDLEYFEWTVFVHNEVNKKLGKPVISVETALQLYR